MTDTVVQFINTTGKTYSELTAGVTIASNAADEQAVVKDVVLTNPGNRSLTLNVGDAVVAEVSSPSKLEGSELLGASTSLTLKTTAEALLNKFRYFSDTSTAYINTFQTLFSGSSIPSAITGSGQYTSLGSSLTAYPYFAVIAENGDFYYSNNAGGSIYRRAGGISGSQSTITSYGNSASYDGRYIYGFADGGGDMAVIDTQNNGSVVQGSFSGMSGFSSSEGNSAAIDGYVWIRRAYNEDCYLMNGSTRVAVPLGGQASGSGQRYYMAIGKNSSGDYIGIHTDYTSPNVYWFNFGPSLATAYSTQTLKSSGSFSVNLSSNYNGNTNNFFRMPGSENYLIGLMANGGNATIFNLDNVSVPTTTVFSNVNLGASGGKVLIADAIAADADFGLVNVRATGIKTTP